MPDQYQWLDKIPKARDVIKIFPPSRVVTVREFALAIEVDQRTAQRILKPLITVRNGRCGCADRTAVLNLFDSLAPPESEIEAQNGRDRLNLLVEKLKAGWNPPALVRAPMAIASITLDQLAGVRLEPGRIVIEGFRDPQEALRMLLGLALAVGRDRDGFESRVAL